MTAPSCTGDPSSHSYKRAPAYPRSGIFAILPPAMKVLLASPRGFCAGVDRAIDVVELALQVYGTPLYVKHAIVHNTHVVQRLEAKGVTFIESVAEIPEGGRVVFSAHGSPPADYAEAKERKLDVIDATCPLVTKVHLEVQRYAREGYTIILVGHRGHVEMRGTMGEAPERTHVVETVADVDALQLPADHRIAVLTQTTLSVDDTRATLEEIRKRFPQAVLPPASDICYATTNRQKAVTALAASCGMILVIGSATSSNTNRLVDVARAQGCPAYRIDRADEIQDTWLDGIDTVGVTSGASAPEDIVQEVVRMLQRHGATSVETLQSVDERVWFDLPAEVKAAAVARGIDAPVIGKHTIRSHDAMSR